MIIALASQVQARLKVLNQLEINKNELSNIEATLAELQVVDQMLVRISNVVQTIITRLSPELTDQIQSQANAVAVDIERSRTSFAENRRQVRELRTIQQRIQRLNDDLSSAWKNHAGRLLTPQLEVLALIRGLPGIAVQEGEISRLVTQLQASVTSPPQLATELGTFDAQLDELKQRLAAVQLSSEIKAFLGKVQKGAATIADLTPTVLEWCLQGNHANAFAITFAEQKGMMP